MDQIQDQKQEPEIKIVLADESHVHYVDEILETIAAAARSEEHTSELQSRI